MIIKKYSCKRFAGIKDKCLEFQDGINVLLGENESGKSTLIEGIHSVMFKTAKNDRRSAADKAFYTKFMPLAGGDIIDSEIIIAGDDGEYKICKEWGKKSSVQLITPKMEQIVSEERIDEVLKDVFVFGEGTFSNILFTKQAHLREALQRITGSRETTSEISTLLRKAVMELDGVSIDDLELKINDEIEKLLKRWDIEREYPENNKGINNPYKTGIGEVLTYFYLKERLRLDMEDAAAKQMHFDDICLQLKDMEGEISTIKQQKTSMEQIEEDVIKRSQLEPKIAQYEKDQAALMKINQEWPKNELKLEQLEKELAGLEDEFAKLGAEKAQASNVLEKEILQKKLEKVNELNQLMEEKAQAAKEIINVTRENFLALEKYERAMRTAEAKMQAGVMMGKLMHYKGETGLTITRDIKEPVSIKSGDSFNANGFIRLENEKFCLEVKSGDMDFAELRKQYEENKKNLAILLEKLNVNSIEEAKFNRDKMDDIQKSMSHLNIQITDLLEEDTREELMQKLESYGDLSSVRELPEIETVINALNNKKVELLADKKSLESTVAEWRSQYIDINGLLEKIVAIKMAWDQDLEEINKLAPLPAEFESTDMFRNKLSKLREDYEKNQDAMLKLREEYFTSEKNLPESSYEDLKDDYKQAEETFRQKLEKGKKLLKIKEVFAATRAQIDDNSFKPMAEAFSRYIVILTNHSFTSGEIDNSFELKLNKDSQTNIPVYLLSTGTYDSVALALRLAILEYIFSDTKSFMILDDCLVDMDPVRKQTAAELIKNFAQKHQVIFTTCNPETAELLGGNIINL